MRKLLFYLLFAVPILGFGQTKISDMPAATTPTGAELVPIVQSGVNKKATINQINNGYIKTADFYTIGDSRWLKLPSAPGSGQNGQSVRWNNGSLVWEYFTPGAGSITGSGTTNEIPYWVSGDVLGSLDVSTYPNLTEFSYLKGVTGSIMSLNGGILAGLLTGNVTIRSTSSDNRSVALGIAGTGFALSSFNSYVRSNNSGTGIQLFKNYTTDNTQGIFNLYGNVNEFIAQKSGSVNPTLAVGAQTFGGTLTRLNFGLTDGIQAVDQNSTKGLFYAADYSTNGISSHSSRWIPDWGAVNSVSATLTNKTLTNPQINGAKLETSSTAGHVWTASSTDGSGGWAAPSGGGGAWLLASGGTATGTNTFAMGTNPFILTSGVTTGTGATAGIQNVFNSLTTGNGLDISSSSVSSGAIVKITGTGTAAASNTQSGLVVDVSGANATSTQTTYGGYFSNTHTGTSSINNGVISFASGGTTNNAYNAGAGNIALTASGTQNIVKTGGQMFIGNTDFNTLSIGIQNTNRLVINGSSGAFTFTTNLANSGSITPYTFNDAVRTNQTASTETNFTRWTPNTTQFATGTQTLLRAYRMGPAIYSFVGASDITNAYTLWVDKPVASTNATILQNWAAGFDGNVGVNGGLIVGTSTISSANDRVKINGIGTTTGKGLVVNNSSGTERFSVQDDGVINVSGSGGTAGQVLVSNGTSAAAWGTPTVNITGSNQRYQTQVANISSSLVASGTGFASLSNPSEYANKSVLSVDFVIAMIKNDGTAVVYGKLTSIFRKDNSGTWTADVPGTPTISDITQLSGFVGDINGGAPGITWTTPGTTSGTWQLGYTAAISSTTN